MPDKELHPDDQLAQDIAALSPSDQELANDIQAVQEPAQDEAAIADARNLAAHQPLRGDQRPQNEDPWYTNAFRDIGAPATVAENLVPANLADEVGAGAIGTSPEIYAADDNQGYTGIPAQTSDQTNDYAAGSQFEDNRRTLEAEKAERDKQHPGAAIVGQLGQGALEAATLPISGPLAAAATGAGLTAANYMGQGSGDLSERAGQAAQMAEEHPISTAASIALPAAAAGAGKLAGRGATKLADASAINRTAAVMTPAQRAAHMDNFGGKAGLVKLGNEMSDTGLASKSGSKWWPGNWLPASAEDVHTNAVNARRDAGSRLGVAEDALRGTNPPIQVGSIAKDLRSGADDLADSWRNSAPIEAKERQALADRIDQSTQQAPIPDAEGPTLEVRDTLPFQKAVKQRRGLDTETNFNKAGGIENAGLKDQINRQAGTALRQNIRAGLDEAAAQTPELAKPVAEWNKANKDFSLASTIEDPAQLAMLKEYGGNLGLRDMSTAAMAHALGLPGPVAAGAAAAMKGGRGANALAGSQKNLSNALGAFGTAAGPSTLATTQAALPDPEVAREKNKSMKEQLADAWDWAKSSFKW